jgi:hypothetical protein
MFSRREFYIACNDFFYRMYSIILNKLIRAAEKVCNPDVVLNELLTILRRT